MAAIGNDGANRVTSVGAADKAITVGSIDDDNSIERDDDEIASYSNYGPRTDDGDEDSLDELKPDVVHLEVEHFCSICGPKPTSCWRSTQSLRRLHE